MNAESPSAALTELLAGGLIAQGVACAAELRVADLLDSGPRSSDEIAAAVGAHPPSLYRLLRMLAMVGVVAEHEQRVFSLTAVGARLRTREEGSLAPLARFFGDAAHATACGALLQAVRTGRSAFRCSHGDEAFAWFAKHPDAARTFHEAMTATSSGAADAVLPAYDFSRFEVIADVGGGQGLLLARILEMNPGTRGVLFDRSEVVESARGTFRDRGLLERCTLVAGDFFRSIPEACDAYLLKNVLHDWGDDACIAILARCAAALGPAGRVLVLEHVLTPPGVPSFAKLLDVEMLVMSDGGRERTQAEYASLFAAAGLTYVGLVPTESPMQIVEARRAT